MVPWRLWAGYAVLIVSVTAATALRLLSSGHPGRALIDRLDHHNIHIFNTVVPSTYDMLRGTEECTPIVFLHGFDSSCLESRHLIPLLNHVAPNRTRTVFAPDILGWGFGDYRTVKDFSPEAKMLHMKAFLEQVVKEPCILVGASLGGGMAVNLAADVCPELVTKLVLIDPQAFIDGTGTASFPEFLLRRMVRLLRNRLVRSLGNKQLFNDPTTFATDLALEIASAHCHENPDWERASLSFLRSGGFKISHNVPRIQQPTLILWGRKDRIIPPEKCLARFQRELAPGVLRGVRYIEDSGHVPHLERPELVAEAIREFAVSDEYVSSRVL